MPEVHVWSHEEAQGLRGVCCPIAGVSSDPLLLSEEK